jgi:DNA-damage-inducible protein J
MSTTIQIRIEKNVKTDVKKIFNTLGLDMSTGIKMYLQQVLLQKGIPFQIITENSLTTKEEKEIIKASKEAQKGKNITRHNNMTEAIAHLKSV